MKEYINKDNPVYFSYAWGDELEEDVNKLCELMDENGIFFKRDKAKGENSLCPYRWSINDAEKEIGGGTVVIVVISERYLKSLYCMLDWHSIRENGNIQERVFPIVLEDANITDKEVFKKYYDFFYKRRQDLLKQHAKSFNTLSDINNYALDAGYFMADLRKLYKYLSNYNISKSLLRKDNYKIIIDQLKEYVTKIEAEEQINFKGSNTMSKYINEGAPIYITYARSDSEHEHIDDVVDVIKERFVEEKIQYSIDTEAIDAGDTISTFEKEIGEKPYTILIYSDKYFRSWDCMYELTEIRKNKGKKKGLIYIQADDVNLSDEYISELENVWLDNEKDIKKIKIHNTRKLTAIESEAEKHKYYIDSILDLKSFFSAKNRLYANKLINNSEDCLNGLIKTIRKKWFGQKYDSAIVEQKEVQLHKYHLGDFDSAKANYEKAIAIGELLPKDNPEYQNDLASSYKNLANLQQNHLGDYYSAKANYEKAIAILHKLPQTPETLNNLANIYNNLANLQTT